MTATPRVLLEAMEIDGALSRNGNLCYYVNPGAPSVTPEKFNVQAMSGDLQTLAAAYRALLAQQQWQPISTAPRDGSKILGVNAEGVCAVIFWDGSLNLVGAPSCWAHENSFATDALEATHWMPLPKGPPPPEEKGG